VKAVLIALLLFAVTHTGWDRFADKAMTARAVGYPVLVGVPALVWWLRRSGRPYPAAAAFIFTVPFVVDCLGNAANLYDTIDVFDDVCHFVNWAMLCTAVGLLLLARPALPGWVVAGLCTGFGAVTAILWEIGEYGAFVTKTPERFTLYRDTIGDLTLGLAGSMAAGVVVGLVARARWTRSSDT
jgi:hypothetical protein